MKKRPTQLVPHRVLVDRATGRPVGPTVPIAAEDWPYFLPPSWETLWRYMDEFKFRDSVETSTLYFARCDQFTDPFEGRFGAGNKLGESKSDEAWRQAYGWARDAEHAAKYHEIHRWCVFISCWHRANAENALMWRNYTAGRESVVITSSVKALTKFSPQELVKSAGKYHDDDSPRTPFDHSSLFFYKPQSYNFEREFRLLRSLHKDESVHSERKEDLYRRVPVRLQKVVHRVITHPAATPQFKSHVEGLLRRHLPGRRRHDSALLALAA